MAPARIRGDEGIGKNSCNKTWRKKISKKQSAQQGAFLSTVLADLRTSPLTPLQQFFFSFPWMPSFNSALNFGFLHMSIQHSSLRAHLQ